MCAIVFMRVPMRVCVLVCSCLVVYDHVFLCLRVRLCSPMRASTGNGLSACVCAYVRSCFVWFACMRMCVLVCVAVCAIACLPMCAYVCAAVHIAMCRRVRAHVCTGMRMRTCVRVCLC